MNNRAHDRIGWRGTLAGVLERVYRPAGDTTNETKLTVALLAAEQETPDTWPVCPVLWEGGGRETAPYPIFSSGKTQRKQAGLPTGPEACAFPARAVSH